MSKNLNITFEIIDNKQESKPVTFYHIDALTIKNSNAVIISGGKEWIATASYEIIWEKIKRRLDEINA